VIVWVSMNKAWYWGFFIGTVAALVGFIFLALGKPFYNFQPLGSSPFVKIAQVTLSLSLSLIYLTYLTISKKKFVSLFQVL
jgi:hypothetical protein